MRSAVSRARTPTASRVLESLRPETEEMIFFADAFVSENCVTFIVLFPFDVVGLRSAREEVTWASIFRLGKPRVWWATSGRRQACRLGQFVGWPWKMRSSG